MAPKHSVKLEYLDRHEPTITEGYCWFTLNLGTTKSFIEGTDYWQHHLSLSFHLALFDVKLALVPIECLEYHPGSIVEWDFRASEYLVEFFRPALPKKRDR
ncbi:hypothetical protein ACMFMG_002443 [Clarireedia jacksonii]